MKIIVAGIAALTAAVVYAPMARADDAGPCTALYGQVGTAYRKCILDANASCRSISMWGNGHETCTYPDGGRDECDYSGAFTANPSGHCVYIRPGP